MEFILVYYCVCGFLYQKYIKYAVKEFCSAQEIDISNWMLWFSSFIIVSLWPLWALMCVFLLVVILIYEGIKKIFKWIR